MGKKRSGSVNCALAFTVWMVVTYEYVVIAKGRHFGLYLSIVPLIDGLLWR